jgi:hypothetical protein
LFVFAISATPTAAQDKPAAKGSLLKDEVVAGGPKDFMEVRHIVLKGTNEEIGHALGKLAAERFKTRPIPAEDPLRVRVQRKYIEKNDPILFERMRGVAASFGEKLANDQLNFTCLPYLFDMQFGCSVVHFPPSVTADKTGIVSRNYDFTTGTVMGKKPAAGQLPCTARPYIVEMHPDRGYASLALYSYDLLNGVLDGINSEGLTVALLADDETLNKYGMEPAGFEGVGLGVVQMQRLLLDTCATVEEAKEALLMTKQYYDFVPVHFLVADRHGKSFVWEYSQAHNKEYIIENPGKPLVTTNFSLHRHMQGKFPPSAGDAKNVCPRYCAICDSLASHPDKLTLDLIKETHKKADILQPSPKDAARAPTRTLWHALYVPEERSMQISFYLRDEKEGDKLRIARTDYREFLLKTLDK